MTTGDVLSVKGVGWNYQYDPEANAGYIRVRPGELDDTVVLAGGIRVDLNEDGLLLGVEVLFGE